MNYTDTVDWLYTQLPAYQRIGKAAFKKDLTNIRSLCAHLGDPQSQFPSIHVAGTNGKGSVSHMLASVFQTAGYCVGLYTSPHLLDFRERIRIDGQMISKQAVIGFVQRMASVTERIRPSFFEITVAMAFDYFRKQRVDIAIVETGLGGRLDSTNVLRPELSVITHIGLEHQDLLGDTLEKIAGEKAGIIKRGTPVVIGRRQPETELVFRNAAAASEAPVIFAEDLWVTTGNERSPGRLTRTYRNTRTGDNTTIQPDLTADYQEENIRTVLASLSVMKENTHFRIPVSAIVDGLASVTTRTGFRGRWQQIAQRPAVIIDGAHNAPGLLELNRQLQREIYHRLRIVFGTVREKDLTALLPLLPEAPYYITRPPVDRARKPRELAEALITGGKSVAGVFEDPSEALEAAVHASKSDDLVLVTGSLFLVGLFSDRGVQDGNTGH